VLFVTGGTPLKGRVRIEGGKTAAGFLVATALLADSPTELTGVPRVADVTAMIHIARANGVRVDEDGAGAVLLRPGPVGGPGRIGPALAGRARASIIAAVALALRHGRSSTHPPGGCAFAPRPIDIHLRVLAAAGARVGRSGGQLTIDARRLRPFRVGVDGPGGPSAGATVTALLTGARIAGTSEIRHANQAPETVEVARLLARWGVEVTGAGTRRITVTGPLTPRAAHAVVAPDRIEAGTFAIACAVTDGRVQLDGMDLRENDNLWTHLRAVGVEAAAVPGGVEVHRGTPPAAPEVTAGYFPHFPTDLHPQLVPLLAQRDRETGVRDLAFPGRLSHLPALADFGVVTTPAGPPDTAGYRVRPSRLRPGHGAAPDIRAGAALVIAALGAAERGTSAIHNVGQISRGYAAFGDKLTSLGAALRGAGR
jgi:UDP-N-acetylglucosamine 1-carboxyvinyltransferase